MVDTTAKANMANQDIVTADDRSRINSAADKWWSNMLAVIKLRQKGTTIISKLPSGVFRYMLEYEFPKLLWRYSDPYMPPKYEPNTHFPSIEKLDYNN